MECKHKPDKAGRAKTFNINCLRMKECPLIKHNSLYTYTHSPHHIHVHVCPFRLTYDILAPKVLDAELLPLSIPVLLAEEPHILLLPLSCAL